MRGAVFTLALLALTAAPVRAQVPAGTEVALRALERQGQADYQGTQVTVLSNGARQHRTEQIVRFRRPNLLRIEYLAPPRLQGDVVLDDGMRTRRYVRRLGIVEEAPAVARGMRAPNRSQILKAVRKGDLQLVLHGEETVAGRRAWVLSFTPADPLRPRRKLWLDTEYGVPLRVIQTGPGGRVSETSFRQITFQPVFSDADLALPAPAGTPTLARPKRRVVSLEEAERIARQQWGRLYQVHRLPPGFTLQRSVVLEFQGRPVIHLRYGDGRRGFSLFQSAGSAPAESLVEAPVADENAGGRRPFVLQLSRGRARLALVGAFAPPRLQRIAESIE